MTSRIILLSIACLLALGIVGTGVIAARTGARYVDDQSSSGDSLAAATLNLQTNNAYGVTATLNNPNMKPGTVLTGTTINLRNTGSLNGSTVSIVFSYGLNSGALTADQVSSVLQVTTLTYDSANLISGIGAPNGALVDVNGNGYVDLQDLSNAVNVAKLAGLAGLTPGQVKPFNVTLTARPFHSGSGFVAGYVTDACQGSGVNLTITFTLNQ